MALVHTNHLVGTTAGKIVSLPVGIRNAAVSIQNNSAAAIYVGDATITTSGATQGHIVAAGATYQLWLNGGDQVFAIAASATSAGAISILYSGL